MINEFLGIIATIIVLLSFLVKGEQRIRLINLFGAALFVVYGILIGALSVWVLNLALCFIQIYHLRKNTILGGKNEFYN